MTTIVADEVLGRFARQQNDWFRRVREGSLDPEEVGRVVQSVIDRGHLFAYDKRKDGWKLVEDVDFTPIDPAKLDFISFLKPGEGSIGGNEMVRRARELHANFGQRHAEYLLEHQREIPQEFRKYYIVFTGTIWRIPDGGLSVACLLWDGGRWILDFHWLENDWGSGDRLPRSRE
ncbi:MAG: hypothetical protein AAB451_00275 [Patescibacteria group bacterium]